jgi:hypothetical protein
LIPNYLIQTFRICSIKNNFFFNAILKLTPQDILPLIKKKENHSKTQISKFVKLKITKRWANSGKNAGESH